MELKRGLVAALAAALQGGVTPVNGLAQTSQPEVWFTANSGSDDLLALFARPEKWPNARRRISVYSFYLNQLIATTPTMCPHCGQNLWPKIKEAGAIQALTQWRIQIAVSAPMLKRYTCSDPKGAAPAAVGWFRRALENVQGAGGTLSKIDMDEPLHYGAKDCGYDPRSSADLVAEYIRAIQKDYPGVRVGDTEPYPSYGGEALRNWVSALISRGAKPDFFHLDINFGLLEAKPALMARLGADLRLIQAYCEQEGVPFGVIAWSGGPVSSSEEYHLRTIRNLDAVKAAGLKRVDHLHYESWVRTPGEEVARYPSNLPETGDFAHTHLILEGLDHLGP